MTSFLRAANLARVPHAFTTRRGGVSAAPFDSLNFGNPGELPAGVARDPRANIEANFALVCGALGVERRRIVQVHQVHERAVLTHRAGDAGPAIDWGSVRADAIVTDDPGVVAAVRVADCAPILIASADGRVVAAIHAGWRGVVAGVVGTALEALLALGARQPLHAAIGPCIGPASFEVGPEVVRAFHEAFGADAPVRAHPDAQAAADGKALVDLNAAIERQLRAAGVESIADLGRCTASEPAEFFSHRRDRGVTGRMIGVIGPAWV